MMMPAPPGHWSAAPRGGWPDTPSSTRSESRLFQTPDELWTECVAFLRQRMAERIAEEKVFQNKGQIVRAEVDRIAIPTWEGLASFLRVSPTVLHQWRKSDIRPDLQAVLARVEGVVTDYILKHAAVEQVNPGLAARYIGLSEKVEQQATVSASIPDGHIAVAQEAVEQHMATLPHPLMPDSDAIALHEAGRDIPLFSRAQLDAGLPWVMPTFDHTRTPITN